MKKTEPYAHFACGLIRGALSNVGVSATVKADISKLPACNFTLVDLAKKARSNSKALDGTKSPVKS